MCSNYIVRDSQPKRKKEGRMKGGGGREGGKEAESKE